MNIGARHEMAVNGARAMGRHERSRTPKARRHLENVTRAVWGVHGEAAVLEILAAYDESAARPAECGLCNQPLTECEC